jgi:hypothetical protein
MRFSDTKIMNMYQIFEIVTQCKGSSIRSILLRLLLAFRNLVMGKVQQDGKRRGGKFAEGALILISILILVGCEADETSKRPTPDVSHIKLDSRMERFDQDLFALDTNNLAAAITTLEAKYPELLPVFAGRVIHDESNPDETPMMALNGFLRAPELRNLYDSVQATFPDLAQTEKDVSQVLKYYKYYFPDQPDIQVTTIISEFGRGVFPYGQRGLAIGLDFFLGKDFSAYAQIFPQYVQRTLTPEYIPVNVAKSLAEVESGDPKGQRLLDLMLYHGKKIYIASLLVPYAPDSMLMGYTNEQMQGCYFNEKAVWKRILDEKLLYSTNQNDIRKLVNPSPNAPKVFDEAPGEIANWVGWRIVEAWMKKHPNTPIKELLAQNDSQKFLEEAGYRPKR